MLGLYAGQPGARRFRQCLSEGAALGCGVSVRRPRLGVRRLLHVGGHAGAPA